jgi:hypothetical protein
MSKTDHNFHRPLRKLKSPREPECQPRCSDLFGNKYTFRLRLSPKRARKARTRVEKAANELNQVVEKVQQINFLQIRA